MWKRSVVLKIIFNREAPPHIDIIDSLESDSADWDRISAGFSYVFGIIGWLAYIDQRRATKENADVIEWFRKHKTQEVTEEQLAELSLQLKRMEKQTREDIPRIARQAVLKEPSERIKTVLSESFSQYQAIENELGATCVGSLDSALETAIADRMLPSYIKKQNGSAISNASWSLAARLRCPAFCCRPSSPS
jgi:hypothetical protein